MNPTAIKEKVFVSPGYSTDLCLSQDELDVFRVTIEEQWLARIAEKHPEYEESFRKIGLENYHKLSHGVDHKAL